MSMRKYLLLGGLLSGLTLAGLPVLAEERTVGEGEHRGSILHDGEQVLRVESIKPGQTIQARVFPQWNAGKGGRVEWGLTDGGGAKLRAASHRQPEDQAILLEWTSNSEPLPDAYRIQIQGKGGQSAGEVLGQYVVQISLWDQNDGDSGTDAPETYEKALELPVYQPGVNNFIECFASGTGDIYDIYRFSVRPNHSLTLKATPVHWKGTDKRGKVHWNFLNQSFKRMKDGQSPSSETSQFLAKVYHPQVRSGNKPAIFYFLVKIEGDVSLIYSIQTEVKEGR